MALTSTGPNPRGHATPDRTPGSRHQRMRTTYEFTALATKAASVPGMHHDRCKAVSAGYTPVQALVKWHP